MLRRTLLCFVPVILSAPVLLSGEDFAFARPRPLMALCAELQEKYGLPITYEDAPFDVGSELDSEIIPRNGMKALTPKWKPIIFRVPSDLPTLDERKASQPRSATIDPGEALAAVQTLVNQYNQSGNPGHFSVTEDGQYLHIQQTTRTVSGKLQSFEPVSDTLLPWESKSENCNQVIGDLSAALVQVRGFGIAQGNIPSSSLMHYCNVEGNSVTVRQVLSALVDGLSASNVTAQKMLSYTWDLVYDPNWNKYFLSFWRVPDNTAQPVPVKAAQVNSTAVKSGPNQGSNRIGAFNSATPHN